MPSPFASELAALSRRVRSLESGRTRFSHVSLDGTSLPIFDEAGNLRQLIGLQPDGSYTTVEQNAPPPVTPSLPVVEPALTAVTVTWDGFTFDGSEWPADFKHVELHLSSVENFIPTDDTHQEVFTSTKGGTLTIGGLIPDTPYYVVLIAVNRSGLESGPTAHVPGIPFGTLSDAELEELAQAISDTNTALANKTDFTVTTDGSEPSGVPKVNDVWFDQLNGEINYWDGDSWEPHIAGPGSIGVGVVRAAHIAAGSINADHIVADSIQAAHIGALQITTQHLAAESITASKIKAGAITADMIGTGSLHAVLGFVSGELVAGNPDAARVAMGAYGIRGFDHTNTPTVDIDAGTGRATFIGEIGTAPHGEVGVWMGATGWARHSNIVETSPTIEFMTGESTLKTPRIISPGFAEEGGTTYRGLVADSGDISGGTTYRSTLYMLESASLAAGSGGIHSVYGGAVDDAWVSVQPWQRYDGQWVSRSAIRMNLAKRTGGNIGAFLLSPEEMYIYGPNELPQSTGPHRYLLHATTTHMLLGFRRNDNRRFEGVSVVRNDHVRVLTPGSMEVVNAAEGAWRGVIAASFTSQSDRESKTDIAAAPPGALSALRAAPVYKWRYAVDDPEPADLEPRLGVMAEDLPAGVAHKIEPTSPDSPLGVDVGQLVNLVLQAVQELDAELDQAPWRRGGPPKRKKHDLTPAVAQRRTGPRAVTPAADTSTTEERFRDDHERIQRARAAAALPGRGPTAGES